MALIAQMATLESRIPVLHFFDGFRTSHEEMKVEEIDYEDMKALIDDDLVRSHRYNRLSPDMPFIRGTAQNPDVYFQEREISNTYYDAIPEIVESYMAEIKKLTGREYHLFNYYGAPDADRIIVAMGSVCDVIEETVDYLNGKGEKVGLLTVHLYRPFSLEHFFRYIPKTVKKIAVLDRTKEPGSIGEPLYLDVKSAFYGKEWQPLIVGGRYGLGSKDVIPSHILPVFENLKLAVPKDRFTLSIVDDVTFTSLPPGEDIDTTPAGTTACKFWGLGSDGTVGANKAAVKIIGQGHGGHPHSHAVPGGLCRGELSQERDRHGNGAPAV